MEEWKDIKGYESIYQVKQSNSMREHIAIRKANDTYWK